MNPVLPKQMVKANDARKGMGGLAEMKSRNMIEKKGRTG